LQTKLPHTVNTSLLTSYPQKNHEFIAKRAPFQYIVDNIMLSNYHTLAYITASLQRVLPGLTIQEIFTQNRDELVFSFETNHLVFSCQADLNAVYLDQGYSRARVNSTDVLKAAEGCSVSSVLLHPGDRALSLSTGSGMKIILQLYGSRANALLIDPRGIILDAFRRPKELRGGRFSEPSGQLEYNLAQLPAAIRRGSQLEITSVLRKLYPSLGQTLLQELFFRSSISPQAPASGLDDPCLSRLQNDLEVLLHELAFPSPRVYLDSNGTPIVFSILLLHHRNEEARSFADVHEAIRFFLSRHRAGRQTDREISAIRASLQQQHSKLARTLRAMSEEAREAERAGEYEAWGQLLMSHLQEIRKGDLCFQGNGVTIKLDPRLNPVQNAQRYFEKSKRSRTAAREKAVRLRQAEERQRRLALLLEALDDVASKEGLRLFTTTHRETLELLGIPRKPAQRTSLPFHLFVVDGGFEVLVGKSSESNDLLTLRHAKPRDLWFHARGSSGSHVVLKVSTGKGTPGKRAREQAAAIAAYYSRMKSSSLVPVAMTERKFVRKPKGSPAGSVVIERETVLLVRPALPPRSKES
jgi:predicted ribosome quality control (RQC) complex YloA/Tae2 family protein